MKKVVFFFAVFFAVQIAFAQAPEKISYQAVIRDGSGALVTSSSVGIRIDIAQGSASGPVVFSEVFSAMTNANGLVSLEIGTASPVSVDWSAGPYFIVTYVDPSGGTSYTVTGSSPLLSVPYALHAKTAENGFSGDYNDLINAPTNVSAFTNDSGYLTSFTETDGSVTNEIQFLSRSNDTIFLSNGGFVKLPAGFDGQYSSLTGAPTNVSAFTNDAGYLTSFTEVDGSVTNEIQVLSRSNDTIFLSNGGFVKLPVENDPVYNASVAAGITSADTSYWNNKLDTVIETDPKIALSAVSNVGRWNGTKITNGIIYDDSTNVGIGTITPAYKLEVSKDAAFNAVRIGRGVGDQSSNTVVGANALTMNTSGMWNTAIGAGSLNKNSSGGGNTAIGHAVMPENTLGQHNTAMGSGAMYYNVGGDFNTAIGANAMHYQSFGSLNTAVGFVALRNNGGFNNLALGAEAGFNNTSGSGNVFLGYKAGYSETGSNKLYIANSDVNPPLIYGDFSSKRVGIGTNTPATNLDVIGNAKFGSTSAINIWEWDGIEKIGIDYNIVNGDFNMRNPVAGKRLLGTITATGSWGIETTSGTELVRITGAGNMGIGTTSPSKKLHVVGDINFTGDLYDNGTLLVLDGSETKVNAGTNVTVTGSGTIASPYVINTVTSGFAHYVGELYGGGVVFNVYKDALGVEHGLIVSLTDVSTGQLWSNMTFSAVGPGAQSPWNGIANTPAIIAQPGHTSSAASVCAAFSDGGFSDWYLPSVQELSMLWDNLYPVNKVLSTTGGATELAAAHYWSSTENNPSEAFFVYFLDGKSLNYTKNVAVYVRAIRAF